MLVWFVDDRRARRALDRRRTRTCWRRSIRATRSRFLVDNGWHGFLVLGSVFLVVTGGEALYADMGHFGRRPIRIAWFALVLPALLLNYFGQGALLLSHPDGGGVARSICMAPVVGALSRWSCWRRWRR